MDWKPSNKQSMLKSEIPVWCVSRYVQNLDFMHAHECVDDMDVEQWDFSGRRKDRAVWVRLERIMEVSRVRQ